MMPSKENTGKGNTIRSSDLLALLQQKRQQTILRRETSHTTSPATRATSSSIPKGAGKHSRQSEQTILRRPPTPTTTALRTTCLGDSPNDNGDDVDITSQPPSPTIPTTSSTKRPLTARNGNISEGAQTRSRQTEPTLLRRLPTPTTGLRTPSLGDSPNDNGDNVDITLQPQSPTISTSSTKPPLTARGRHFIPKDKRPINIIGQVIKKKFDGAWPRYSHVPSDVRKKWWRDFKSHWYISKEDKHLVRSLFEKKTGERLRDMLYEARKCYRATRKIPEWIPVTVFEKMLDFWKTEKYIRSSDANSSNRRQNSVGGLPVGTYNGGSRSFHDYKVIMEKLFGRPVSLAEVFMATHTNKENKEPVDDNAAVIEELFKEKMPHILPYFGQKDKIPDDLLCEADEVFLECAGALKNGCVKGLGNLSFEYTSGSISHSMPNEVMSQQVSQLREENSKLSEDLSSVRKSLEEERQRAAEERAAMKKEIERIAGLVHGFTSPVDGAHQ